MLSDSSDCNQARSDLINPRRRLSVEIAWLPGLSSKYAESIVRWLSKPVKEMPSSSTLNSLFPLVRANVLASGLQRLDKREVSTVAKWILELARAFDEIDPEKLCAVINEERIVSGFPEVTDLSTVEMEIQERRRYYGQVIKSALKKFPFEEYVKSVTLVVISATDNKKEQGPILICDLVDNYEVEAQAFFEKETQNIETLIENLRASADAKRPDSALARIVDQLIQAVKNWDTVAHPIQVSTKSRGLNHDASHRIAGLVRGLSIHLFNEHGKLELSKRLTGMLQEVFAEVVEVAERTAEDVDALEDIAEQNKLNSHLDPILNFCKTVFENVQKDPFDGDYEARRIIDLAPQLLLKLSSSNIPDELVSRGKDELARTLMYCAINYGNKTSKWRRCVKILNKAIEFASSEETKKRIQENLLTANNNDKGRADYINWASVGKGLVYFFVGSILIGVISAVFDNNGGQKTTPSSYHPSSTAPRSYNTPSTAPQSEEDQAALKDLALEIDNEKAIALQMENQINKMDERISYFESRRKSYLNLGWIDEYNKLVPVINSLILERSNLYNKYSQFIDDINAKVKRYNSESREG